MKILAVETATEACSVALLLGDNNHSIDEEYKIAPQQHSKLILPMIDTLLQENNLKLSELDAIAFGRGPGSFIGVRIAASLTQGLAFANNIPVIAVSSLQAVAQAAYIKYNLKHTLATIDARMQQLYCGLFVLNSDNIMQLTTNTKEQVVDPEFAIMTQQANKVTAVGSGAVAYLENAIELFPSAQDIAIIAKSKYIAGELLQAHNALPTYIRDKVVK